jgi:L-iditol 2-dehydrogenase
MQKTTSDALVFRSAGIPTLEQITLPSPGDGDVRIKVEYSGVSIGTETSIITGKRTHNGTFPLVSGYMGSGVVESAGTAVKHLKPGDRVACFGTRIESDVNSIWGAHSAWHVCDASMVHPLPDGCDMRDAALWVLPAVGLNAAGMAGITERDSVVISGQGLIGQFFAQWAVARGARVIVIEPDPLRRELAGKLAGAETIDPASCDVVEEVSRLTDGEWPTVVVEATGVPALVAQTTGLIRRMHARMVFLAWYPGQISIDFSHLHNWEATAFFPMGLGNAQTARGVLQGLARHVIQVGGNLTDCVPWREAPDALRRVVAADRSILGMVIDWRDAP